jgi:hypothetical protein
MIGLISVSKINNLTQISQGIYRLRNINYGHFVDFYTDEDIIKDIPKIDLKIKFDICKLETIIDRLEKNDILYKNNAKSYMKIQSLKHINRNINNMNKDTFIEDIFYDLITYDGNFLKINEFEKKEILKIQNNLTNKVKIVVFDTSKSVVINTNLSVQVNIEQQIEQQIQKNNKLSLFYSKNVLNIIKPDIINIDNINEANKNVVFTNNSNNDVTNVTNLKNFICKIIER